ncbi:gamma-glutamylcyclotransferase [Thalassobius sp. MITS945101]|uniref:gamma-glutamylcyclotransferase n=1 Tax=Thalassobius sp. MITS945101 TaxID=3096994 RepID=UPI00399B9FBE
MTDAFFFGYGSLVNRKTHVYADAHRVKVSGWRRAWRHTALRPIAFLTAIPYADSAIDGLIAGVPGNDWAALDTREFAYDRIALTEAMDHPLPQRPEVAIYAIPEGKHGAPDRAHPVLLSYLDVVVQGYLEEFGEAGVADFFATTDGWEAPILDDRAAPYYPRAQALSAAEQQLVDRMLMDVGAKTVQHTEAERAAFDAGLRG